MKITRRESLVSAVGLAFSSARIFASDVSEAEPKSLIVHGETAMLGVDASGYSFSMDCLESMKKAINGAVTIPITYRGKLLLDAYALRCDFCGDGNAIQVVAGIFDREFLLSGTDILNNNYWLVPSVTTVISPGRVCSKTELVNLILTPSPADKRLFPIHKFK